MAWIRWRTIEGGTRLAALQWRDGDGKVHSKALRTSDERLAKMHLNALKRELGETLLARPRETDGRRAVDDFLREKGLSARPATIDQYRRRLGLLLKAWDGVPVTQWDRRRFIHFISKQTWSPRSPRRSRRLQGANVSAVEHQRKPPRTSAGRGLGRRGHETGQARRDLGE